MTNPIATSGEGVCDEVAGIRRRRGVESRDHFCVKNFGSDPNVTNLRLGNRGRSGFQPLSSGKMPLPLLLKLAPFGVRPIFVDKNGKYPSFGLGLIL